MIRGVGIDLLEIERMEQALQRESFLQKVFTQAEREYLAGKGKLMPSSAAAIFCAKEALGKALGVGLAISLQEMEVTHGPYGEPLIALHGRAAEQYSGIVFHLSLTHTASTAGAVVVAEEVNP